MLIRLFKIERIQNLDGEINTEVYADESLMDMWHKAVDIADRFVYAITEIRRKMPIPHKGEE